jgi:hypothetical protein
MGQSTKHLLALLELPPHPQSHGLALHGELPHPRLATDVRETEKGKGLRLALATPHPVLRLKPAKLDQPGLLRV